MWHTLALAALAQVAAQSPIETKKPPRDPRTHALSTADALWSIPNVSGRIIPVGDIDGDGRGDLFVERGVLGGALRIDAVSSCGGKAIRTVYTFDPSLRDDFVWDAGGDVDGDGVPDLVLGFPDESSVAKSAGMVRVISGRSGSQLYELHGSSANDRFGCSLAFLGDIDGDQHDDFAVGAPQFDRDSGALRDTFNDEGSRGSAQDSFDESFLNGKGARVTRRDAWQFALLSRSAESGFVSLRSGRNGSEIRRLEGTMPGHGFGSRLDAYRVQPSNSLPNLLVQCDIYSVEPIHVYRRGAFDDPTLVTHVFGWASLAGDIDGDSLCDVAIEPHVSTDPNVRLANARFWTSKLNAASLEVPYPQPHSEKAMSFAVGDVDGDGFDDIAIGDANYNFPYEHFSPSHPLSDPKPARERLHSMTLDQALSTKSDSWQEPHSGCALVVSGRTHRPIFGAWGEPGSGQGLGLHIAPLPDITGDGLPDLVVSDGSHAYAFASPGKAAK